ncbi:hypothetical protein K439DRAFT_1188234 [Ramaria rubella]|nr:hypothetical protein K439DRAFT_1188234 [Ramaria rubella]
MAVFSKLENLPDEVLEEIVIIAVKSRLIGPPDILAAILQVSRTLWKVLARRNNPILRFSDRASHATQLAGECIRRFEVLQRLRCNAYPRSMESGACDGDLTVDLWIAYLMFLEHDGKNVQQLLQYSKIDIFSLAYVRPGGRLHDGTGKAGWTADTEVNALALWLFWFTDKGRLRNESQDDREAILGALGCLYVGSFKVHRPYLPNAVSFTKRNI